VSHSDDIGAALDACSLALGDARADNAQLRDELERRQLLILDQATLPDAGRRRQRDLERQLADLVARFATPARAVAWAVCQVRRDAEDLLGSPKVVQWPLGRETPGVHSYQLLRGPFPSEFEACVQLLLSAGAYPDTPEGFADACAAVVRVPSLSARVNEMVLHPSIATAPRSGSPWVDVAPAAQLRVVEP
jgi:hypothetical protein